MAEEKTHTMKEANKYFSRLRHVIDNFDDLEQKVAKHSDWMEAKTQMDLLTIKRFGKLKKAIKILINERSKKSVPKSEEEFCMIDKGLNGLPDVPTDLKEQDCLEKKIEIEIKEALLKSKISFDDLKQPTRGKY